MVFKVAVVWKIMLDKYSNVGIVFEEIKQPVYLIIFKIQESSKVNWSKTSLISSTVYGSAEAFSKWRVMKRVWEPYPLIRSVKSEKKLN